MNRREKGQAKEEDDDDEDNENDDMEGPTDRVELYSWRVTRANTIVAVLLIDIQAGLKLISLWINRKKKDTSKYKNTV